MNVEHFSKIGLKLVAESKQLNGPDRFMVENFIREDQCVTLADLITVGIEMAALLLTFLLTFKYFKKPSYSRGECERGSVCFFIPWH